MEGSGTTLTVRAQEVGRVVKTEVGVEPAVEPR